MRVDEEDEAWREGGREGRMEDGNDEKCEKQKQQLKTKK